MNGSTSRVRSSAAAPPAPPAPSCGCAAPHDPTAARDRRSMAAAAFAVRRAAAGPLRAPLAGIGQAELPLAVVRAGAAAVIAAAIGVTIADAQAGVSRLRRAAAPRTGAGADTVAAGIVVRARRRGARGTDRLHARAAGPVAEAASLAGDGVSLARAG